MTTQTSDDTHTHAPTVWLDLADAPAIDGLRFRRPRGDDADYEAMAAIVRAANTHDGIPWLPSTANLREELEDSPGSDVRADLIIGEIDGVPVAEAGVDRVMRDGVAVYELWGHVIGDVRRRGIGRAMLRENLRRVAERGAAEPDGQPWAPRAHAEDGETGHRALLAAEGFEPLRYFFLMRRPTLDDIPDAPLPPGLEFRPVTPEAHRAIFDAENEAFRDHWQSRVLGEEDFVSLFKREELDTSLWVVAWEGDQVAAVSQNWIWRSENEALGVQRGWLEHISVRRPWRRRGVGRAITAESLRRLRAAGMTDAMLGVDADSPTGALGLYEGLGFEVYQRSAAYHRPTSG